MWGSAAEIAGGRVKKCFEHLLYWEMGEGADARSGGRVDERDEGEHFKYPLVTKTS